MAPSCFRRSSSYVLVSSVLVFVATLVGASSRVTAQEQPWNATARAQMPEGAGKETLIRTCGVCHDPMRAASVRLTEQGWTDVLGDMLKRGAKATDDEQQEILGYLTTNFLGEAPKPININSAPQIDFESVLGLLRREAAAVVAYREKNGPFKTVSDMKKVQGLDYKKVESQTDRIVCF